MIKFTPEELKTWEEVFKPKVYDKKGLNKKMVMKYLLNAHKAMEEVYKVYHHVTNGLVTNFATPAVDVIAVITELDNKNLEGILKDEKEKWTNETSSDTVAGEAAVERVYDTCLIRTLNKLNQFHTSFEVFITSSDNLVSKYMVIWDSQSKQMSFKANKVLPEDWQDVARQGIIWLMNTPDRKEMMLTK